MGSTPIKNWRGNDGAGLTINSSLQRPGKDFRQGIITDTDGTKTMLIWLNQQVSNPQRYDIIKATDIDNYPPTRIR